MLLNKNTNVKVKKKISGGMGPAGPAGQSLNMGSLRIPFKKIPKKILNGLCYGSSKNRNTNKNKNEKCGGMWLLRGSFVLFYLLCALLLGPGALIGMIIMIISLRLLSKAAKAKLYYLKELPYYNSNNINNNSNNINNNGASYIDKVRTYIFRHINGIFVTVIICNILITLILSKYV
jgi:hypothetical protein